MPVQIVQEINDCTRFPFVVFFFFYQSGGLPLYSFNILAMLLSMWVPYAAGVFQTTTNEGDVGLTFNILWWTGIKITSNEEETNRLKTRKIAIYQLGSHKEKKKHSKNQATK